MGCGKHYGHHRLFGVIWAIAEHSRTPDNQAVPRAGRVDGDRQGENQHMATAETTAACQSATLAHPFFVEFLRSGVLHAELLISFCWPVFLSCRSIVSIVL